MMMRVLPYPNWRHGAQVGAIVGTIMGCLWFAACVGIAHLPAVSPVSLCWTCRPWWKADNWVASLVAALVTFVSVAVLAACRPQEGRGK